MGFREPLNPPPAQRRILCPISLYKKFKIHKVYLHFLYFDLGQNRSTHHQTGVFEVPCIYVLLRANCPLSYYI